MYSNIINAFLVMGGLSILIAILLIIANHFFRVDDSDGITEVEKVLPGVNCGACGYVNCNGFAKAVIQGKIKNAKECKIIQDNNIVLLNEKIEKYSAK